MTKSELEREIYRTEGLISSFYGTITVAQRHEIDDFIQCTISYYFKLVNLYEKKYGINDVICESKKQVEWHITTKMF